MKGFTLIELLIVLTILAILALITTPFILSIIQSSKKESMRISAEHYLDAVEVAISASNIDSDFETFDGNYEIINNGVTIVNGEIIINLTYDGVSLSEGTLVVRNGLVVELNDAKIDKFSAQLVSGKVELYDN